MKKRSDFYAYLRALFDAPINILFVLLDIVGVIAVICWVVDDPGELAVVLLFIVVMCTGYYLIFKKQRATISSLGETVSQRYFEQKVKAYSQLIERLVDLRTCHERWFFAVASHEDYDEIGHISREELRERADRALEHIDYAIAGAYLLSTDTIDALKEMRRKAKVSRPDVMEEAGMHLAAVTDCTAEVQRHQEEELAKYTGI